MRIGQKLGPYEVVAKLGQGGMGEVYRARDTNLGRDVAIKVLPEAFATDRDRLARFEREARTLASLNHPNIAQIYGVERSEGVHALVMELVAGDDLSVRLATGPFPIAEALAIARQIANALEAAHETGIVHRDLKPANIKVREDGTVKVLDFGLAKAVETSDAGQDFSPASLANSPTLTTPAMTAMGMILGTAAYMSPEQAKGRPADKRSDIWAFGCVFYEMLTGRRAFVGDDVGDTLASVLAREPDLTALPAGLSPAIRTLVDRCLVKDRRQRLGDIAAVHLLLNEPASLTSAPAIAPTVAVPRRTRERLAWTAALMVSGALALAGWLWRPTTITPPEYRLQVATPPFLNPTAFAISPDGLKIAFWATVNGKSQIWLQFLDKETARPLEGTEGTGTAGAPFWSPDSRSLGFMTTGKLRRVDVAGGLPRPLADLRSAAYGGAWGVGDTIVYAPANSSPLLRVSADRGEPVPATVLAPEQAAHRFPSFLPDGRHFLFLATGPATVQGLYVGSIDSTESHRLFESDSAGAFLAPDLVLFRRDDALVAQRLDLDALRPVGNPFAVAPSVARYAGVFGTAGISSARTGTLAYRPAAVVARQLEWHDRTGTLQTVVRASDMALDAFGAFTTNRLSPNAAWTTAVRRVDGNSDLWIVDTNRGTLRQLTTDPKVDEAGVWSPGGDRVVFQSQRRRGGGQNDLFIRTLEPGGVDTLLLETGENKNVLDWSSDGRTILYRLQSTTTGDDVWALPMDGDRPGKPFPVVVTPNGETGARFSPDGRWIAYQSTASGATEILVQPFPSGSAQQVSQGGGSFPAWSRAGHEIVYLSPDNQVMAVPVTLGPGDAVTSGTPVKLFREPLRPTATFDVTKDGQRFLINTPVEDAPTPPITIVLNWGPAESAQPVR